MQTHTSEQENGGLALNGLAPPHRSSSGGGAAAAKFRFATPRALIDWRALHGLDLAAIVRDTDIDALESVLDVVAYGDIEGEDTRHLTPTNCVRAFRVAQLTVGYLLHVQDCLAADSSTARVRRQGRRDPAGRALPMFAPGQRTPISPNDCSQRNTCPAGRAGGSAPPRAAAAAQGEGGAGGAGGQPQGGPPPQEGAQDI